jgi:hypothetical protein
MCADRWGTASCPRAARTSASSTVDSMPWLGEAVTVTLARGGSAAAASIAFFNGMSSNFGAATRARIAMRCAGGNAASRFLPIFNATPFHLPRDRGT